MTKDSLGTAVADVAERDYFDLVHDEAACRVLLQWYYEQIGNVHMATRMWRGDRPPTVELSQAQSLARERMCQEGHRLDPPA